MTLPVVIFDDIELWATTMLRAALAARAESYTDNVWVDNTVPNPRHDRMVIIRRDGGPRLDVVREAANLAVNVWGETEQVAMDLARLTAALLWSAPDGDPVVRVDQTLGPSPVPDSSDQARRFMTFDLIYRGRDDTP